MSTVLAPDSARTDSLASLETTETDHGLVEDPLARYIIDRAIEDPRSLAHVPSHVRAHRAWFRAVAQEILAVRNDPQVLEMMPEFVADAELRRVAGMNTAISDRDAQRVRILSITLAHYDPDAPGNAVFPGPPISDASPAVVRSEQLFDGRQYQGVCDVCGEQGIMTGEILMTVGGIRTLMARTCACAEEHYYRGNQIPLLYEHGRFVETAAPVSPPRLHDRCSERPYDGGDVPGNLRDTIERGRSVEEGWDND